MRSMHASLHILVILMSICQLEFTRAQAPGVNITPPTAPGPISPSVPGPISPSVPSPISPSVPSPISPSVPTPISSSVPSPISPSVPSPISPPIPYPNPPTSPAPIPCYQCNLPNTCSCSYYITNYVSCRLSELKSQIYSSLNQINKQLRCHNAGGRVCSINNACYAVRTVPRAYSAARSSCINLGGYVLSTYTVSPNVAERCMDLEEGVKYWVSGSYNGLTCPAVEVNSDHSLSSTATACGAKLRYICQIWI